LKTTLEMARLLLKVDILLFKKTTTTATKSRANHQSNLVYKYSVYNKHTIQISGNLNKEVVQGSSLSASLLDSFGLDLS